MSEEPMRAGRTGGGLGHTLLLGPPPPGPLLRGRLALLLGFGLCLLLAFGFALRRLGRSTALEPRSASRWNQTKERRKAHTENEPTRRLNGLKKGGKKTRFEKRK